MHELGFQGDFLFGPAYSLNMSVPLPNRLFSVNLFLDAAGIAAWLFQSRSQCNGAASLWRQAVVLSFCFDCPATRLLGVENHVCELQLLPASLMPLLVITFICQQVAVVHLGTHAFHQCQNQQKCDTSVLLFLPFFLPFLCIVLRT